MREPDERATICVITALEGQNIPWVLQQQLIQNVAEEIRAAMADERQGLADLLDLKDASEESLAEIKSIASTMQTTNDKSGRRRKKKAAG